MEFTGEDLRGARFEDVQLSGAVFHVVDLAGARFQGVNFRGVTIRGADVIDVEINGDVRNLQVNGVDVAPLIEAELNRRDPERVKMRPADAAGFREAWEILERRWAETVERARALPAESLHERVNGEWSFIETLRHLVFATDAWIRRTVQGVQSPWDPLDLPHDEMSDEPGVPRDRDARPSLDEVLALRADRVTGVRELLAELTEDDLKMMTAPVPPPGYPASDSYLVRECLEIVLNEEWHHRDYAERDLAALTTR